MFGTVVWYLLKLAETVLLRPLIFGKGRLSIAHGAWSMAGNCGGNNSRHNVLNTYMVFETL